MIKLSCDDGCASDMKVSELAKKYGVPCTFYWPVEMHSLAYENSYTPLSYEDAKYIATYHNIGSHTITHRHLTKIPMAHACYEIQESKYMLQNLYNTPVS